MTFFHVNTVKLSISPYFFLFYHCIFLFRDNSFSAQDSLTYNGLGMTVVIPQSSFETLQNKTPESHRSSAYKNLQRFHCRGSEALYCYLQEFLCKDQPGGGSPFVRRVNREPDLILYMMVSGSIMQPVRQGQAQYFNTIRLFLSIGKMEVLRGEWFCTIGSDAIGRTYPG